MSIFTTELEVLDFLSALGMGLYGDYDRAIDCEYWYIATGGHDGRVEYKSLNRLDCIQWANIKAREALLWADELRALGKSLDTIETKW